MSAASELRGAIENSLSNGDLAIYSVLHRRHTIQESNEAEANRIDAILDAVIASLPDKNAPSGFDQIDMGFKFAIDEVEEILQSAKTQKGEE